MKNLLSFRNPSILLAFFLGLSFHFVSFTGNAQTVCYLTGQPVTLQDDAIVKDIAEQYDGYLEGIYLIDIDSITQITSLSPDSIQLEVGLEELHESLRKYNLTYTEELTAIRKDRFLFSMVIYRSRFSGMTPCCNLNLRLLE